MEDIKASVIERFSNFRKQSAFGTFIFFFESIRKNIFNFIIVLLPIFQGKYTVALFILIVIFIWYGSASFIKYYYFAYSFDFSKSEFLVNKGFLKKTKLSIPFEKIQQINLNQNLIHKIFDLYEIQMDTAGSSSTEVDIKAVSKKTADDFKIISQIVKKNFDSKSTKKNISESINKSLKINLITLVKAGLTSRYFETLGLITGTTFVLLQYLDDLKIDYADSLKNVLFDTNYTINFILLIVLIIITFVLTLNLITTVIKFFNFSAKKKSESLEIEFGLIKTRSIILSPLKVQEFRISQNWLQKQIKIREIRINQASSDESSASNNRNTIKVPGCSLDQKNELFEFIYQKKTGQAIKLKPNIRKFIINFFCFSLTPSLIVTAIYLIFPLLKFSITPFLIIGYLSFTTFVNWRLYKNNELYFYNNFIKVKSGFWDINTKIIQSYKIQSVVLTQPIWHKKYNLGNVTFLTAGGQIRVSTYKYDLLKKIVNNVLFKAEKTSRRWM